METQTHLLIYSPTLVTSPLGTYFYGPFPSQQFHPRGKELKSHVCNRQMSHHFWAQQYFMVPAPGFSHNYFLSKDHFEAWCPAKYAWSTEQHIMCLLSQVDYRCRTFKGQVQVYSREYLSTEVWAKAKAHIPCATASGPAALSTHPMSSCSRDRVPFTSSSQRVSCKVPLALVMMISCKINQNTAFSWR